MRKTHITIPDHAGIGTDLLAMDKALNALVVRLSSAFGPTSHEADKARQARSGLLSLRCSLESRVMEDFPDFQPITHVYFGTDASRAHAGVIAKITSTL